MPRDMWANVLAGSVAIVIAGCGGHDNDNNNGPHYVSDIAVPNIKADVNFSFDIGAVSGSHYYFTDRNNASLDQIDIPSKSFVKAIQGSGNLAFTGLGPGPNSMAGPDGATPVGSLIYAGDVNSVKIVDPNAGAVVSKITVSATGVRADEGCLDAAHGLFMISSPEENPPFATFINTTTQAVVAKVTFTDNANKPTAGLEACRYDANSDNFYVNVDGSTANPHGELVRIPGASIRAIPIGGTQNYTALAGVAMYGEGNCDPTGLALGPGNDIAVGCREGTTNAPLLMQIFDRSNGALLASLNAGGGDQLEYDTSTNRYYNASSRWTSSGNASTNGACSAASPCTPVLTIVDAGTRSIVTRLNTGNNAHSVAIDPATGLIFVPYSSATSPAGCPGCAANGFVNGGLSVFAAN
ncbi:YncE family protein [Caballeronia glebae]|uniref:YncE family protein n=1 Tax=Caballeronia glebae TaxID=1777143 RepID=UPI0038BC72D4